MMMINSIVNLEIVLFRKFMKNFYFRRYHNHIFYLFYYDELIQRKFNVHHDDDDDEVVRMKPFGKIPWPYIHNLLLGIINITVTLASIILIKQPKWINDYDCFDVLSKLFPADGLTYLMTAIILCTINTLLNAFYATSTSYEQFQFLLPIQYVKWRNMNEQDSKHYEWIRDWSFFIARYNIFDWSTVSNCNDYDYNIEIIMANIIVLDIILAMHYAYMVISYMFRILSYCIIHIHYAILSKSATTIILEIDTKII
nr:LOW QUALITY PROTEIN: uncharacterized protein LOC124492724 [Dermatophagoides farinae]